jgi:hypothetical protein
MNIIQQQNRLKSLTDEAVVAYIANPTGEVPTYLAVGEHERRRVMRNKYAAQQAEKPPIVEQIIAESMTEIMPQPQMAQGIATPMAPPMAPQEAGIAANPAPNVGQNYNAGGIVGFAAGDYVDRFASYSSSVPGYQDAYNETSTAFQDDPRSSLFYKGQQKTLDDKLAELDTDSEKALYMSLIKGGAKAAQSTSPYFASALGEGVETGADTYGKMTTATEAKRDLLDTEKRGIDRAQYADVNKRTGDFFTEMRELDKNDAARSKQLAGTKAALSKERQLAWTNSRNAAQTMIKDSYGDKINNFPGDTDGDKSKFYGDMVALVTAENYIAQNVAVGQYEEDDAGLIASALGVDPKTIATKSALEKVLSFKREMIDAATKSPKTLIQLAAQSLAVNGRVIPAGMIQSLPKGTQYKGPDGNIRIAR